MVGLWLLLLAWLLAQTQADGFNYELPKAVLEQLCGSSAQFDAWTRHLSESLSTEQQQRLAWNVRFLETPKNALELRQLQQQLSPSNLNHNSLKLWLWISFYWQLRRSQQLDKDNLLLPHFVLTLRQLHLNSQFVENDQLQNMLQSLPRFLIDLVKSRWLCLKHDRDQLYLLPGGALQLGVNSNGNSNCSMWQVQLVEEPKYFLRLENVCEEHSTWFVNMLHTHSHSKTYMLLDAASDISNTLCVQHGDVYLEQARTWNRDCQWQLNDCTQLPTFLNNIRNRNT